MSDFYITIDARVRCQNCHGTGLIRPRGYAEGCEDCVMTGKKIERVELDAAALIALGNAIRTVQSAEYAEQVAAEAKGKNRR